MSKEHQFIIKTIVRGDRTPMYLETYSLGDRSSQVYKDAMKLLNSGDAQQEASLEMALAVTKEQNSHRNAVQVNHKPLRGLLHVNDIDPAGQVDLSVGGQQSYVSPGMTLARELEQRYPNKNWKGRVNKAFDAFNEMDSKYSPQDIAVCLLSLCPNHDMESKYRELLALDFNVSVNVVRDILRLELDRMVRVENAMKVPSVLRLHLSPTEENPVEIVEGLKTGFETRIEKVVAGVLFEGEELKDSSRPVTVIPLENNLRAWVHTEVLNDLVCQAVDNDWTAAKLRRKVENLFNTAGTPNWFTVVEGWFNTAMDVERASRSTNEDAPLSFVADLRHRYHPEQLDDVFLINAIENAMQSGKITLPEAVDAVFEVQGNPADVSEFRRNNSQTGVLLSSTLYQECEKRFTLLEERKPHFIVGNNETQEITSVTQTTYYRNEQFKDHICFGSAPGSRSQEEIIGVLAYEMEANENEPDCVCVKHYQFFYQGDSVFVTDRYGNTVDRLR